MAKIAPQLNVTQIKNAKPADKEYNLGDRHGLTVRVKPNGTKLWRFNYQRPITKKRANLSLGKYPDLFLAKAVAARELLADGIDPKEHRDNELKAKQVIIKHSFEIVAHDWLKLKASEVKEGTYKTISNSRKYGKRQSIPCQNMPNGHILTGIKKTGRLQYGLSPIIS